jgi:hypothetical protein
LRDQPVRPEIRKKRIGNSTKAFRPGVQTIFTINGDTQDLGIYPLEPVQRDLVRGDLRRSYWRPGQGEKRDDDIFLAQVITQADFISMMRCQDKVRGILPYSQSHDALLQ